MTETSSKSSPQAMQKEFALILGAPRSGTTLFAAMLSAHPEACILTEDYYGAAIKILSKKISGVKLCTPNQILISNDKRKMLIQRGLNFVNKRLGRQKRHIIPSAMSIEDYLRRRSYMKIFYIIRNPVDAIQSEIKRNEVGFQYASHQWFSSVDIYQQLKGDERFKDKVILVDYDDLTESPENVMRQVLSFLNTDYSDKVFEGFKHTPQYKNRAGIEAKKAADYDEETLNKFNEHLNLYNSIKSSQ